jgi:hypothetical protein
MRIVFDCQQDQKRYAGIGNWIHIGIGQLATIEYQEVMT